jgi:hypothetical protein
MAAQAAAGLDRNLAPAILNTAKDLTLKLLECGRVSRARAPELFAELVQGLRPGPKPEPASLDDGDGPA